VSPLSGVLYSLATSVKTIEERNGFKLPNFERSIRVAAYADDLVNFFSDKLHWVP